jgi:hypothetical protein
MVPNKQTFPSGIKALADYVHAKGLKLGIYSDAGYASYPIHHSKKTNRFSHSRQLKHRPRKLEFV